MKYLLKHRLLIPPDLFIFYVSEWRIQMAHIWRFFFAPLLALILLATCSGLEKSTDFCHKWPLCGNYVVQIGLGDGFIATTDGTPVVTSQVGYLYFDTQYIFVTRHEKEENASQSNYEFWAIEISSGEVTGPMTVDTFNASYPTYSIGSNPEWVFAGSYSAIRDRWEELNPGQSYE